MLGPMRTPHALVLAALLSAPAVHAADAPDPVKASLAPVFQSDLEQTLERLRAVPEAGLSERSKALRACVLARFDRAAPEDAAATSAVDPGMDPQVAAVLSAYRRYWTAALMHRATPEHAEAALSAELGRLLPDAAPTLEARGDAAVALAQAHGWHAQGGLTRPLQDFMLWRGQSTHREAVELPGGRVEVAVTLLDGFASYGWGAWGTCNAAHTGGWTTAEGLFVVAPSWDLASEDYRVSLLAHEGQHFADNTRFPALAQTDLEYRAKLVELSLARASQHTLLAGFAASGKRDRELPHPFAEWWVMRRLAERLRGEDWHAWNEDAVRAAARAELAAHTQALEKAGSATIETALP